jgi:hypothetical protein
MLLSKFESVLEKTTADIERITAALAALTQA